MLVIYCIRLASNIKYLFPLVKRRYIYYLV